MQFRIVTWALLSLSVFAVTSHAQRSVLLEPGKVLAVVNGEKITGAQLNVILSQMGERSKSMSAEGLKLVQQQALDILIDDALLQQYLNRYAPAPESAEINKQMVDLKEGLKKSGKTYEEFLKDTRQSEAQIRKSISRVLQWSAYSKKYITDARLLQYYQKYKDFFDKVVVRASHIVLQAPPGSTPADHTEIRKKLSAIREQIISNKVSFVNAVKAHSMCPSVKNGGDIGSFPRKFVVDDEFARVAFSLKVGEISNVVKTDFGYHLIKVTERKPGTPSDFNKIKDDVREIYLEDHRIDVLKRLRHSAKLEVHLQ